MSRRTRPAHPHAPKELPRYLVTRPLDRMSQDLMTKRPLSKDDDDRWQYGLRPLAKDEIVETGNWPHPSMWPMNEAAKVVHNHFVTEPRISMPPAPVMNGRIMFDNLRIGKPPPPKVERTAAY